MNIAKKTRPKIIAFDVIETLFALDPIADRLASAGLRRESLPIFFSRMLRDAFALEISGVYTPFKDVATATLKVMLASSGIRPERRTIKNIIEAFTELPPHPDVRRGFELARSERFRTVALTNGSAKTTKKLLSDAGLYDYVEDIISIDEIQHWKPKREAYVYAARKMLVAPQSMALVAAHAWDIHGAARAGLMTVWVRRQEKEFARTMSKADIEANTLEQAIEGLSKLR